MFSENLKNFRKQRGLTQEELAERLHVVRQTVSKWEKGLSVPDAALLIRIAEIFETSVGTLLGETVELSDEKNIVAQKLEQLNALLAEKNRRGAHLWKIVSVALISIVVIIALFVTARVQVSQNDKGVYFEPAVFPTEKNERGNPFVKEILKTGVEVE